ncbi:MULTISPECIES: LysR family transcriptional regulator [unclassified Variovorax]|jgi:DNA-binding transcriptional LysR family regulator|uniref:LysR family transcriptional regulator n=1 Tax=unclassified Variovorax TaxID=663243 RepID=UPI0008CE8CDB|nr:MULTISPECIES: LysR family transcriptional regulator [unclassified Variovorax]SEK10573.1 DNA-binding transcriptional regulator, LysR family [Variovorax sp. OK202]SFD68859.1 DNA-binding transcriptional regulator, LysR family [Variovorax sp. OK212]
METLANLESFVRSAEARSFSGAARRLGLTPAGVSRNVARLETNLGVRLFVRSTRKLSLTEAGERLLDGLSVGLETIQSALAAVGHAATEPSGTLRVTMPPGFGTDYVLPLLPGFTKLYPKVLSDWHLDNRRVDLISEGFDVAIGGGFDLSPGVVARELARIHLVAVASPAYVGGRSEPKDPLDLQDWDWIGMTSIQLGRVRSRRLRNRSGREVTFETSPRMSFNDPEAVARAVAMGLGVTLMAMPHAAPLLRTGVIKRVLPNWYWDDGPIAMYYPGQKKHLPAKTRAFIDYVTEQFKQKRLAEMLSAH